MTNSGFNAPGEWLRCQLHAHTTNSDGEATPAELVAHYSEAGFDVLAITDHFFVTSYTEGELLVIGSSELSAHVGSDHEADVLALGARDLPDPLQHFPDVAACAAWVRQHGGVPFLAHPYWSGLDISEYLSAPDLAGIETFNGGCDLESGTGSSVAFWDAILQRGVPCLGIACDDSHQPGRDSRLGWTMVRAPERSREAVLEALREGSFYGSCGPVIEDLTVSDDGIIVRSSPAKAITLRSAPWEGGRVDADASLASWRATVLERDEDGALRAVLLRFPERANWGRVEVLGSDHRVAWTNPLSLPNDAGGGDSNWDY